MARTVCRIAVKEAIYEIVFSDHNTITVSLDKSRPLFRIAMEQPVVIVVFFKHDRAGDVVGDSCRPVAPMKASMPVVTFLADKTIFGIAINVRRPLVRFAVKFPVEPVLFHYNHARLQIDFSS